jgi:hypothetical protein
MRASEKCGETALLRHPLEDAEWRLRFQIIHDRVRRSGDPAFSRIAEHIAALIHRLDPLMTAYCRATCPGCPDPCCHGRKVFFNLTDLIHLAVLGEAGVPGQTRTSEGLPCRYLGPKGCGLSRRARPYVCVWFLCEPQMERLRQEPIPIQRAFTAVLQEIRRARLLLEALYELTVESGDGQGGMTANGD